ncbi:MAG TPA: hypothetical protein VG755_25090 [Nannocystaceae bacterium]|nr:hypothetical protein [Nannocystaceae bacterium]
MHHARTRIWAPLALLCACEAEGLNRGQLDDATLPPEEPRVSGALLEERCDQIKETAAERGITNPLIIAGVANHETHLVQCLSEWPIHCAGPWSDDCGGAVLAGSGDGPCWQRQGGLGMFQFDAGNYDQTLAQYGQAVLDVAGNIDAGISVIIHKVRVCQHTKAIATSDQAAIDFLNRAKPGTQDYELYISSMASCYNGCQPGFTSCSHQGMRNNYKAGVQNLVDALGDDYWSTPTHAVAPSSERVGTNADGRLEIFALASDGTLAHRWQSKPNFPFAGWGNLGGALAGAPAVGASADGRLEVFAIDQHGALAHRWQIAGGKWSSDWESLGGPMLLGTPAIASNADGRIEVFARTSDGRIVHTWQTHANGPFVGDWWQLGENVTSDPVVAANRDGRLELFVRGDDDALHHVWQVEQNGSWSAWGNLGGTLSDAPFVGTNADGRLEIFVVDDAGAIQHKWQLAGAGWVADWAKLPGDSFVGRPVIGINDDGRMEIVARRSDGDLRHIWQVHPNEAFADAWESFGADAAGDPQIGRNADGRLEVFVLRDDDEVAHRWQTAPDSGWSEWESFAGSIAAF